MMASCRTGKLRTAVHCRPQVLEMQDGQVRLYHRAQLPGTHGAASAVATTAAAPRGDVATAAAAVGACEPWCSDGPWVGPELVAVAPLATVVGACQGACWSAACYP